MKQVVTPEAPAIEKDVLSVLCNRPELIHLVEETLNIECFYNSDYQFLFDVIIKIHQSGREVSQSSILHTLIPIGRKDLLSVYQDMKKFFTSEKHLIANSTVLAEYSTKRALLQKSYEIINMIDSSDSLDEIEREVHAAQNIVVTRNNQVDSINMTSAVDGLFELMERDKTKGISGITTGVPLLDKITGGWQFDDIVIFAARPSMGKTVVASYHAYSAANAGYPTAFISLEVKPEKLAGRMISNLTGFSSSDIIKGNLALNQKEIIYDKGNKSKQAPIHFYDNTRSRDINDIIRTMRSWHRRYGIKIIFLDYIGLVRDRTVRDSSNRVAVINSIQDKLTELRAHLGIPIIEFSQLNRDNEAKADKRPILANLKDSGKLEEDATKVIFLYRQDYYDANDSSKSGEEFIPTNDMEYIFAKNREGELGPVELKCDVALNRVYERKTNEQIEEDVRNYSRNNVFNNVQTSF